jgi:hypothetical protein
LLESQNSRLDPPLHGSSAFCFSEGFQKRNSQTKKRGDQFENNCANLRLVTLHSCCPEDNSSKGCRLKHLLHANSAVDDEDEEDVVDGALKADADAIAEQNQLSL